MAQSGYFFADLVREACRDSGSGALTLAGALPGHRAFGDVVPVAAPFAYVIAGVSRPEQWEVGVGQLAADGRLQRDMVRASSADGAKVDFGSGLKNIALTVDAAWFAAADGGGGEIPPHGHAIADVAGLQAALDGKAPAGNYAPAGDYALNGHGHSITAIGGLQGALDGKLTANLVSPFALTILDDGNAAAARGTLGAYGSGSTIAAADGTAGAPGIAFASDSNTGIFRGAADDLRIATGGTTRINAKSDGKIGIGTVQPVKMVQVYNSSEASFALATDDRNDGFFVTPALGAKAGSSVGWIGTLSNHPLQMGTNNGVSAVLETSGVLRSGADNAVSLGASANRWSVVYAGTGTINTSDARDKKWRDGLNDAERAAARDIIAEIGIFQWHDSVAQKGDDARLHIGARAQAVWGIMARHGLVAPIGKDGLPSGKCPYAFLCFDAWDADEESGREAGNRYGLRTDQLALFLVAGALT